MRDLTASFGGTAIAPAIARWASLSASIPGGRGAATYSAAPMRPIQTCSMTRTSCGLPVASTSARWKSRLASNSRSAQRPARSSARIAACIRRRSLTWGPGRHSTARNLFAYWRMVEERIFVEPFCGMEALAPDHEPRRFADDSHASNAWGILPPRSYFRFDEVAISAEREQLEALRCLDDGA